MGKLLRYFSVLSLLIATLVSTSCSKEFLTKEPPGVAAGSVITSPDGVARANRTLEQLAENKKGNNPIPGQRALQIEAEAKFLRAWFHFQANKVFEKIPYIKTKAELYPQSTRPEALFSRRALRAAEDGDLELARSLVNQIRNRAKNSTPVMGLLSSYENLGKDPVVEWTQPAANYKVESYPEGHVAFTDKEEARKSSQDGDKARICNRRPPVFRPSPLGN